MNVYEEIAGILELCKNILAEGRDPFNLDIKEALQALRELKSSMDDLNMDSEAISALTDIIEAQENWIERRLGSMLIDPMLVEFRIKGMSREAVRDLVMKCYHPIATIETITPARAKEGADYWKSRTKNRDIFEREHEYSTEPMSLDELYDLDILSEEEFEERVESMKRELESVTSVGYYELVKREDPQETFERAYVLSFLITEGFVSLDIDRLNDRITVVKTKDRGEKNSSVVIPLWEK